MKLSEELLWRGFSNQTTYKDPSELDKGPVTFYWGVDPSAASMQIGNLAAAMMVRCFLKHGHKAVLLVGGATGLIGDPDGKKDERMLKTRQEIESNKLSIIAQYQTLFADYDFKSVDNYDWFKDMNYLDFLRDTGKHVPMRQMLGRDFVQSRISQEGSGISYAEFSYVLVQAYDFLYLHEHYNVTLQLSGSDQWGNSIAGVDLIRRKTGKEVHVWTTPLIVDKSTGKKFGKSEGGAVWLDDDLTSVFRFYQFWLNVDDDGVESYIKIYTDLEQQEVGKIMGEFNENRSNRVAQKRLAYEVTKIVHGIHSADQVVNVSKVLFGERHFTDLNTEEQQILATELLVVSASADIYEMLVGAGLAESKGQARMFVASGAVSINGLKVEGTNFELRQGMNLIKRGKNSFAIVNKT